MNLHVETSGQGEPLILLHGWGMHGGIWGEMLPRLAESFTVYAVDLPGHGYSGKGEEGREKGKTSEPQLPFPLPPSPFTLDSVVSELSSHFTGSVNLLGWSLGGIIAQHWALRAPQQVQRLVLVASTPCFAEREDWLFGMPAETLAQFAGELEKSYAVTLRRFLALQVRGSEGERELLASLREKLFCRGEPDLAALRGGLDILRDADLRSTLPQIRQPVLAIAGERDKLTPPSASHYLAQQLPQARAITIEGAAHAPFLSHADRVIDNIKSFLHE